MSESGALLACKPGGDVPSLRWAPRPRPRAPYQPWEILWYAAASTAH